MHIKTKYLNEEAVLSRETYIADNSTCLRLVMPNGMPLMTATVCLAEYGDTPAPGHVFLKTWSENEGIFEALFAAGIVGEIVRYVPAGFAQAYEVPLLGDE